LGVLATHLVPERVAWYTGLSFGWAGVDLFFVLSAFLITGILRRTRHAANYYRTFYARRARRILPAATLALTVYTAGMIHAGTLSLPLVAMYATFTTSLIPSAVWFARLAPQPTWVGYGIAVFWTLSVEELFYLGWAPIVRRQSVYSLVAICGVAIVACPVTRMLVHTSANPEYFWFFTRLDALAWGALAALALEAERKRTIAIAPPLAVAALCALFATLLVTGHGDPGNARFAAFGYTVLDATCAVGLLTAVVHPVGPWRVLRIRPLMYVGTISYGLYLTHQSIHQLVILITPGGAGPTVGRAILTTGLSIALAAASWHGFERRIIRRRGSVAVR
jgi:peptidoglycan/LPS O-acetylase OafA/YrhL